MIPQQWASQCGNQCTKKYATLKQIPSRVFCKKGCNTDGDTWEECLSNCTDLCYKGAVLKDKEWSAYIDRSPGTVDGSEECYSACLAGCGFKVEICKEEDDQETPSNSPDEKALNPSDNKHAKK